MAAPRALTPAKEKRIATKYAKGKSSAELAEEFGVHRSTVVGIIRRAKADYDIDVTVRAPGGTKAKVRPQKRTKVAAE